MKIYQKLFMAAATALGLSDKVKAGTLTAEEQQSIFAKYEADNGRSFESDRAANEDYNEPSQPSQLSAEEQVALAAALEVPQESAPATAEAALQPLMGVISALRSDIASLQRQPEPQPKPQQTASKPRLGLFGGAHTPTHLFGIEHDLYARNKWYNKVMSTRKAEDISATEREILLNDFKAFATQAQNRFAQLFESGEISLLNYGEMVKGSSALNYDQMESIAGEYVTRRTDAVFAFIKSLPTVTNLFPRVSNVQNKMVAPTVAIGELSQGYRKGNLPKGMASFGAELYTVDDVMFKFDFEDLVELERQYIGYLNREGSDVIKWTFIEWIMTYFGAKLVAEQNERNVYGVRVPQQSVISNPSLSAANGIYQAIAKAEEEHRVLPFAEIGTYNSSDMLNVVEAFADKLYEVVPDVTGYKIYLNKRHQRWYVRAYRTKYGQDSDFTGSMGQLVDIAPESIVWVPNMPANCYKIFAQIPGSLELLENKPGEMLSFYFHRELEGITAISRWKEGSHASYAGKQFASKAALEADNFAHQFIFTNLPTTEVATASSMSFAANDQIVITGNTDVTTVTGYEVGRVYKLIAKAANAEIDNAGAFSKLESAFTAGAAGDYIKVYAELTDSNGVTVPTGKFLELERVVTA